MDFGSLLHEAQKNGQANKNEGNYYKTKFEPPKKENKSTKLSANIQKFLAQKEKEEKQKMQEAKKQRDQLLSMRDVKATNKIKKMLKVIKSANKSVLEEAVNNNNTAVTMAGPDQPDEDDYGYVSQEASAAYSKMMEKYKSIPDEEKFSSSKKNVNHDLLSTKDRVKAAILRHQEEEAAPHRRKRKSRVPAEGAHNVPDLIDDEPEKEEKKVEKPKPRRPAPPPLDFNQLLKIAEKKQFEPVALEPKKAEKKSDEAERLMTKKQKREYEQLKAFRESRAKREQERDREEGLAGKEPSPVRKPKHELSNKPLNPLSIRIPKIGEKMKPPNPPEQKRSSVPNDSTPSKSLDKERSSSSKSSDDRYKKEDSKIDRKGDVSKNTKPATSSSSSNFKMSERSSDSGRPQPSGTSNSTKLKDALQRHNKNDSRSTAPDKRPSTGNPQRPQPTSLTPNGKGPLPRPSPLPNNKSNSSMPMSHETPSNASKIRMDQRPQKDSRPTHPSIPRPDKKAEPQRTNIKPSTSDQSKLPSRGPPQKEQPKSFNAQGKRIPPPDSKLGKRPLPDDSRPSKQGSSSGSAITNFKQMKPSSSEPQRGRAFPPTDMKKAPARQFPPADMRGTKQFPPRDMNPRKEKPRPVKKQLILDDDSEYDSELDDFIDDGPQDDGNDYSKHIKEIFGYDKSRYRDEDEDDRNMESNFSQVMREEYVSKKIGIMEDLEDMRMEALEKKKKMQNKKRRIDDDDD